MSRPAWFGAIITACALVLGGLWWLSTGSDSRFPQTETVAGLADSTIIQWSEKGIAHVGTRDSTDFFSALGYIHGMNRGWTLTLWRQTARGDLSRWFGPGVAPLDRHVRCLGFAQQARQAYDQLPSSTQRRLQAYAHGVNAALASSARRDAPFVLLDVTPSDWAPWHALLIERLLAWVSTRPLDPPAHAPAPVTDFATRDRQLRRWLHLHGGERSVAWAARPSTSESSLPVLFQRHVLGATAMPVMQEVSWRHASDTLTAVTLPGLPLLPTGRTAGRAWASLLHSTASFRTAPLDSSQLQIWHERLEPTGGDEQLVHVRRHKGNLLLASVAPPATDSLLLSDTARTQAEPTAWMLHWPGFHTGSDLPAWLQRAGLYTPPTDSARFQLFSADGLRVSANASWTVLGSPPVVVRDTAEKTILVGTSPWGRHQARSLQAFSRTSDTLSVSHWSSSDSSTWAGRLLPELQTALQVDSSASEHRQNAVTYLRNWDYSYTPASIGATLFDQWMRAYRAELGHVPTLADTAAFFATYRQRRALQQALDSLTARLGPDVRRWRWERAVGDRRYFPVWSADSLVDANLENMRTTRYAPLNRTGRGHPSAPAGGPSLIDPAPVAPSPTTWEGWMRPNGSFTVRRHHYDPSVTFARSRMRPERPRPVRLDRMAAPYTTTLVPPQ